MFADLAHKLGMIRKIYLQQASEMAVGLQANLNLFKL
jgi:hypothetical protein